MKQNSQSQDNKELNGKEKKKKKDENINKKKEDQI
jgi:hypothetical protein